jgi:hypothetical protein
MQYASYFAARRDRALFGVYIFLISGSTRMKDNTLYTLTMVLQYTLLTAKVADVGQQLFFVLQALQLSFDVPLLLVQLSFFAPSLDIQPPLQIRVSRLLSGVLLRHSLQCYAFAVRGLVQTFSC